MQSQCGRESSATRKETPIRDLLSLKRDGNALTGEQIHDFVIQCIEKRLQESQIGAMLMAMYIHGLNESESAALTNCMFRHGDCMQWDSDVRTLCVDKHSTGGVGDKVSLVLAPALAACGLKVPMLSGRGLEFTGGTLDKLESIPGYNTKLTKEEMERAIDKAGCFITGPTGKIAPADSVLYGIRDVTCTVKNLGLIAGSILSKKLAGGATALVLDIKVGRAAFFKEEGEARELAELLVAIANDLGLPTVAVLTKMDTPIGRAVGNALEVIEAIETLHGKGPSDLVDLVAELGGQLLALKKIFPNSITGAEAIRNSLSNGKALSKFEAMLHCHGVSQDVAEAICHNDLSPLPRVPDGCVTAITARKDGVVTDIDAMMIAQACLDLGAGRHRSDDVLKLEVGVEIPAPVGTRIKKGDNIILAHHAEPILRDDIRQLLEKSISIEDLVTTSNSPIIRVVT